jgi:hypothetical protein
MRSRRIDLRRYCSIDDWLVSLLFVLASACGSANSTENSGTDASVGSEGGTAADAAPHGDAGPKGEADGGNTEGGAHDASTEDAPVLACIPLGYNCTPGDTCCQGTCPKKTAHQGNVLCCNPPGGSCDLTVPNPDAFCCHAPGGAPGKCEGDGGTGACAYLACWPSSAGPPLCDSFAGIPCCDSRLKCTTIGNFEAGPTFDECCVPSKMPIKSTAESILCCSGGTSVDSDNHVTCL